MSYNIVIPETNQESANNDASDSLQEYHHCLIEQFISSSQSLKQSLDSLYDYIENY